ncbi:MAG TPA: peptidoglycan-binding protein, partial [Bacteroidetes bacterium]|nr:peptidoglycan-binding protein [Bacteroidota bacterium]
MNGPVIIDAQKALETGNVTHILKWVKKEQESEVVALFKKTISVRTKGADIREIADKYFFETVVRLHRAG